MTYLSHLVRRLSLVSQELKCDRWLQAWRDVRDEATSLGESDDHVLRSGFEDAGVREFVLIIVISHGFEPCFGNDTLLMCHLLPLWFWFGVCLLSFLQHSGWHLISWVIE